MTALEDSFSWPQFLSAHVSQFLVCVPMHAWNLARHPTRIMYVHGPSSWCCLVPGGYFPLVQDVITTDDPTVGFKDSDAAVLLGAFPRKQGMERKDLMEKNVGIFKVMGEAIQKAANSDIKVLVLG